MVTIPHNLLNIPGLDRGETRALTFVVQEWTRLREKQSRFRFARFPSLTTEHVTRHMRLKHTETMKILNGLRRQGLLGLRARNSAGSTGNGYDGALFGELTPSDAAINLVKRHLVLAT